MFECLYVTMTRLPHIAHYGTLKHHDMVTIKHRIIIKRTKED